MATIEARADSEAAQVASRRDEHQPGPGLLAAAGFVCIVAYLFLEWASYLHEFEGVPVTPWNPGLGLAFALIVGDRRRGALILLAGLLIAEEMVLRSTHSAALMLSIALVETLGYASVAFVARRFWKLDPALTRLRDILLLLAAGLLGAVLTSLTVLVLMLATGHPGGRADPTQASIPLVIGDAIGIAVVSPLVLRMLAAWRAGTLVELVARAPEVAAYVALAMVGLVIVERYEVSPSLSFYGLFLPVVLAALRAGLDGACIALAAVQLGLVFLVLPLGYDTQTFTLLQSLMLVLTITGLVTGVLVSERENAERRARDAASRLRTSEAEAARAARFNLVNGMSSALAHEINQPMTAARALVRSAEVLLAHDGDPERVRNNIAEALAQIDRAADIQRRMREFLRRGEPEVARVTASELVQTALALVRPEASARRVELVAETDDHLPDLFCDRVQIQQVLINLVHNAIEAIDDAGIVHGRIEVRARASGDDIAFSVRDNGPGIGPDMAARMFDPLATTKSNGLGLGLSICSSILSGHNGSISLVSGQPGETEFRFTLPTPAHERYP